MLLRASSLEQATLHDCIHRKKIKIQRVQGDSLVASGHNRCGREVVSQLTRRDLAAGAEAGAFRWLNVALQ